MEIELFIRKRKEICSSIMDFIITTENADIDSLIKNFKKLEILKTKEEMVFIFQLISKISDNHHRFPDFLSRLLQIIQFLIQEIQESQISFFEIYTIFKSNKWLLLQLFERGLIQPDENIISDIMISADKSNFPYSHYLYSGIKLFIDKNKLESIEKEIKQNYDEEIEFFN